MRKLSRELGQEFCKFPMEKKRSDISSKLFGTEKNSAKLAETE
jgi:hypothetical protein